MRTDTQTQEGHAHPHTLCRPTQAEGVHRRIPFIVIIITETLLGTSSQRLPARTRGDPLFPPGARLSPPPSQRRRSWTFGPSSPRCQKGALRRLFQRSPEGAKQKRDRRQSGSPTPRRRTHSPGRNQIPGKRVLSSLGRTGRRRRPYRQTDAQLLPDGHRPYLLGGGGGSSCGFGAGARGAAERRPAEARSSQRGLGGVGGVGSAGLAERGARSPEGLLALRQALILQHLLRAQHTPSHMPGSTLARGPAARSRPAEGLRARDVKAALAHVDTAPF